MPKATRNLVLGIFVAIVFLYPLVPYYHGIVMGVVCVPVYLLYVAIDEDARERLIEGFEDMKHSVTSLAIGLTFLWTLLSATWSLGPMDTVGLGILYLFLTTMFFVIKYEFNEDWMREAFLKAYYISLFLVLGLLLFQFLQSVLNKIPFDRVHNIATLENVNNLAVYCSIGFFQAITRTFAEKSVESKIKFALLSLMCFMGIMLALSRAVLIVVMLGLYYLIVKYDRRLLWSLVLFAALIVAVPTIRHRALDVFNYEQNVQRVKIWKTSIDISKKYPLGGTGALAYRFAYIDYKENHPEMFNGWDIPVVWHAHNMFLRNSSELGIPGLILLILTVWYSIATYKNIEKHPSSNRKIIGIYSGINMAIIAFYGANMLDCYFQAPKPLFSFYFILAISQSFAYTRKIES